VVEEIREALPSTRLKTPIDGAFFSEEIVDALDGAGVESAASVPIERFAVLKYMAESWRRLRCIDEELGYFEAQWKPKSWERRYRFMFIRKRVSHQRTEPFYEKPISTGYAAFFNPPPYTRPD